MHAEPHVDAVRLARSSVLLGNHKLKLKRIEMAEIVDLPANCHRRPFQLVEPFASGPQPSGPPRRLVPRCLLPLHFSKMKRRFAEQTAVKFRNLVAQLESRRKGAEPRYAYRARRVAKTSNLIP